MCYRALIFEHKIFRYFFRVGLCPTHVLPFAGDVDARRASDSVRTAEIAWTRVHAIIKSTRASKSSLSDGKEGLPVDAWTHHNRLISIGQAKYGRGLNRNRRTHRSPRGAFCSVGSSSNGRRSWRGLIARSGPSNLPDLHRTAAIFRDWRRCAIARSSSDSQDALRSSSHLGDAWTSLERPISIRSRLHRTAESKT